MNTNEFDEIVKSCDLTVSEGYESRYQELLEDAALLANDFNSYANKKMLNLFHPQDYVDETAEISSKIRSFKESREKGSDGSEERIIDMECDDYNIRLKAIFSYKSTKTYTCIEKGDLIFKACFKFKIKRELIPEVLALLKTFNTYSSYYTFEYMYSSREINCYRKTIFSEGLFFVNRQETLMDFLRKLEFFYEVITETISNIDSSALLLPDDEGYDDDITDRKNVDFNIYYPS